MRAAVPGAAILGLVLVAALSSAACGSGDDDGPASSGVPTTPQLVSMPATATPTPAPFRDGRLALRAAARLIGSARSFARFQASGQEADGTPLGGVLTLARYDDWSMAGFEGTFGSHEGTVSRYVEGRDAAYLCISGQGQEACLKMRATAESPVPLPAAFALGDWIANIAASADLTARPDGTLRTADLEGACFAFTIQQSDGRACVAPAGELLAFHLHAGDAQLDVQLTSARGANEDDLQPPYAVMELTGY